MAGEGPHLAENSTQHLSADADRQAPGGPTLATKTVPTYSNALPRTWWLRRSYMGYLLREGTSIPIAAWLIWFLVEIGRLKTSGSSYQPAGGPILVAFSIICLGFALWHSYSVVTLAGMITRIPRGSGVVPGRYIVDTLVGALLIVTAVIAGLLMRGGQ
jgi:fumarate reductase subunit C